MNRDELMALATARGWTPGTKLTPAQRNALRSALKNRLSSPDAPRGQIVTDGGSRPMDSTEAADALLEEFGA